VKWGEFKAVCPELAEHGEERFRRQQLCMVGTLRRNGWPRSAPARSGFVVFGTERYVLAWEPIEGLRRRAID